MAALADLILPSNLVLLTAFIGIVLWRLPRWRRLAPYFLTGAFTLLLIFSSGKAATALSSPLEYEYSKAPAPDANSPARAVVVLAAYATDDPNMPLSTRPNDSAMFRLVEAAHLWHACQQCTVWITGVNPTVRVMGEALMALGVPTTHLQIDSKAANTSGSAANMHAVLGEQPFYLVTSAGHMPRSMAVFRKQGLRAIPAPTDYHVPRYVWQAEWSPSSQSLHFSDLAMHEHIGMLWYWLLGRV